MPLLFAYGTLMRGDVRSRWLENHTFRGEARTTPRYRLVNCGEYPGLVEDPEAGQSIEGELYDVSEDAWQTLDDVEAVDEGLYSRGRVDLLPPFANEHVQAYFYLGVIAGLPDCGLRWRPR